MVERNSPRWGGCAGLERAAGPVPARVPRLGNLVRRTTCHAAGNRACTGHVTGTQVCDCRGRQTLSIRVVRHPPLAQLAQLRVKIPSRFVAALLPHQELGRPEPLALACSADCEGLSVCAETDSSP